jgi:hypothetical protein
MGSRSVLGSADVADAMLEEMVADALGVGPVEVISVTAEVADYDIDALTTAGRYRVRGMARHAGGESTFSFFVKVVQSWVRHPAFQQVPPELREMAAGSIPWRSEPSVYRSDLLARLPAGFSMPRAHAVVDLDEQSAAIWLEMVETDTTPWGVDRFARAAYLLGRLAASAHVRPLAELGVADLVRTYVFGRVGGQLLPALRDPELWRHPLLAETFGDRMGERIVAMTDALPSFTEELVAMPLVTAHGDACPRNLLVTPGNPDDFVLIDFGFWTAAPVGFDLTQLLLGEIQLGERSADELPALEAACLQAYVRGLHDEGLDVPIDVVRRSHALCMLVFFGLSAVPFEHLGGPPTARTSAVARERAAAARWVFDLVDATSSAARVVTGA